MRDQLFDSKTVSAGASETCYPYVVLQDNRNEHGLQYKITGDGTLSLITEVSIDGEDWIARTVASGLTKTSGPGSDGKDILSLRLRPSDLFRLKATETESSNSCVLSAWLVQK